MEKSDFKFDTLCDIYETCSVNQTMIYCNSRKIVDELFNNLTKNNFAVAYIHGDMTQNERNQIMEEFRNGNSRVLISTDLLSRGIDIQQISLVINYDIPSNIECYIHRIGRSGRYGRKGTAINFVTNYDIKKMSDIERYYATQIDELPSNYGEII